MKNTTEVIEVDAEQPAQDALARAARVLAAGGLVAFPTETFYGLGAAALDAAAVGRLLAVKGRPPSKPIPVLVDSIDHVGLVVEEIPPAARALMARHWPGPLTLVLRARARVPVEVTAGTGTIGIRVSSHAVARGLPAALRGPVTAPSANPSGQAPPTTATEVLRYFDDAVALVLDGGPAPGGLASTVVDVTVDPPRVIRAGPVQV